MQVAWTAPAALWGLLLLALPIALHLLQRPRLPRVVLPSLRFVPRTPLAAARRRVLHDVPLLLVRAATIASVAVALAGPVLVSGGRQRAWDARVARAIVVDRSASVIDADVSARVAAAVEGERTGAFRSATWPVVELAAAVPAALRWLDAQPPAARELVVVTDAQRGAFDRWPAAGVPATIGVRLHVVEAAVTTPAVLRLGGAPAGERTTTRVPLVLGETAGAATTRASASEPVGVPPIPVTLAAAGEGQRTVEAIWAGLLDEGLRLRAAAQWTPVRVTWAGADAAVARDGEPSAASRAAAWTIARAASGSDEVTVSTTGAGVDVRVSRAPAIPRDEALLRAVGQAAVGIDRLSELEPLRLTADERRAVERPAGPSPPDAWRHLDDTDARWAWATALVLLAVEAWLRRRPREATALAEEVARVA